MGMKRMFTAWIHPKNAPKLSTLQLNIDRSGGKNFKIIHYKI